MKAKNGGEDFYFLQDALKIGKIIALNSTVYPSSRASERVPFGTGPKIKQIIKEKTFKGYNPLIFTELKTLYGHRLSNK